VHRIALEQQRVGLGIGQVVDGDELEPAILLGKMARATRRPIRPNPLIATLVAIY
jgi:hypothetical protein